MEKQVLTTAEAAKLLGVSVRTAQLLIENGPLNSWKTPGGHRRVYLADVLAYMAQSARSPELTSALVILLASPERQLMLNASLATVGGCSIETCADVYIAAFIVGARAPAAVIVDMNDAREERRALLHRLSAYPELGATKFIVVADDVVATAQEQIPRAFVTTANELPAVVGDALTRSSRLPDLPVSGASSLPFPLAFNERHRLQALERTALVGTPAEPAFDRLTWLASQHLGMPVALMTLLSATHQHFKSRVGLEIAETPRSWAICNHTILQRQVFAVPDLSSTPPFSSNPAVIGPPHFRYYAGAPVLDPDGFALGSICVMDYEPHPLDAVQEQTLLALAAVASDEVRRRDRR